MPCLIITGHPCAGKTTLAHKLRDIALQHPSIDNVIIINEESELDSCRSAKSNCAENDCKSYSKESFYHNQLAEKQTRGTLKAAFDRVVGRKESTSSTASSKAPADDSTVDNLVTSNKQRTLVILDSMNYIKGYRYELHCISKSAGEKHGVLWVLNRRRVVEEWNSTSGHYSSELLKELISRYEPPDDRNRWDRPLFTVDVSPPESLTASTTSGTCNNNTKEAASEALQDSVYNMYTLSDILSAKPADSKINADTDRNKSAQDQQQSTQPAPNSSFQPKVKKSAFSRAAPKKSAFTRTSKTTHVDTSDASSNIRTERSQIIIDGIPSALIASTQDDGERTVSTKKNASTVRSSTSKIAATPSQAYSDNNHNNASSTMTLDEQLQKLLDAFLLKTEALKEGTSTQNLSVGQPIR